MDCFPPCSPWCECINGRCQETPVTINAVRLRTPDGRYLQAARGGGGLLVAANVAPGTSETFLFQVGDVTPTTTFPLTSGTVDEQGRPILGSLIALDVSNASWGPSGLRVRVDHNVRVFP